MEQGKGTLIITPKHKSVKHKPVSLVRQDDDDEDDDDDDDDEDEEGGEGGAKRAPHAGRPKAKGKAEVAHP